MSITQQEAAAAWGLLDQLLKNPDTRPEALALLKKNNPKLVVPEIDAARPHVDKLVKLEQKIDAFIKKTTEDSADAALDGKFQTLVSKRGYTAEGLEKLKKLMVDKSIPDPEVAADHFDAQQPKTPPAMPSGYFQTSFIDTSDKGLEPWFLDEDRAADAEVATVLREMTRG